MPEHTLWLLGRVAVVLVAGLMGLVVALAAAYVAGPPAGALEVGTGLVRPLSPPSATASPISNASPLPPPSPLPSPSPLPPPSASPSPTPSARPSPLPSPSPPPATISPQPDPTPLVHIVTPGETVRGIARQYDVTVAQLVELNQLQDPNLILAGRQLLISTPGD